MAKLGVAFLGIMFGVAAFSAAGMACFVTIAQLQYRTLQARATQTAQEFDVSSRVKNAQYVVERTDLRYAQLPR
jgi:hypothetical protein